MRRAAEVSFMVSLRMRAESPSHAMIATGNDWKQTRTADRPLAAAAIACKTPRLAIRPLHTAEQEPWTR